MTGNVSTEIFKNLLKKGQSAVDKKAYHDVSQLGLIEISPEENSLALTTNNLERGFRGKIPVEWNGGKVSFCVSVSRLYDVVKSFEEEMMTISLENSLLVLKDEQEKSVFKLNISSAEDFPEFPAFEGENEEVFIDVPSKSFLELIKKTSFACSQENVRFVLEGVLLEPLQEEGKLRAVASDGHRLACCDIPVAGVENVKWKKNPIVDRGSLKVIETMLKNELYVRIGVVKNFFVVRTPQDVYFSHIMEGEYPDYRAVVPQSFSGEVRVLTDEMAGAVKRISVLSSQKLKPIRFELTSGEMILNLLENEVGEARIRVACQYEGQPIQVTFNADYILQCLDVLDSEETIIKITGTQSACMVKEKDNDNFFYLVMPMLVD